jgi:hypothetical protein
MRIALNWFEVTLPTRELSVPVETLANAGQRSRSSDESVHYAHRIVQRRDGNQVRLLHVTDVPPNGTTVETILASDDANFVKIAVEDGFTRLLVEKGFAVHRKHVGGSAYLATNESLWPDIYTFWRGLTFRAFYFIGALGVRWGIILNYATSQRFAVTLSDPRLRGLAHGKRVVRVDSPNEPEDEGHRRTGILLAVQGDLATVDFGRDDPAQVPTNEWTLPCRRDLLSEYVLQIKDHKGVAELTRRLQQAAYCLTDTGRMNTALAKSQVGAIQRLLQEHDLGKITLPLPTRPPASLSNRPLTVAD